MKLKSFEVFDILNDVKITDEILMHIREEIVPFCLYIPKDHTRGICLEDQKPNILAVLEKYAKEYGIKLDRRRGFANLTSHLKEEGWTSLYMEEGFLIDGDRLFKEAARIIESTNELRLLEAENFAEEWHAIKKEALLTLINQDHDEEIKRLEKQKADGLQAWKKLKEIPIF